MCRSSALNMEVSWVPLPLELQWLKSRVKYSGSTIDIVPLELSLVLHMLQYVRFLSSSGILDTCNQLNEQYCQSTIVYTSLLDFSYG